MMNSSCLGKGIINVLIILIILAKLSSSVSAQTRTIGCDNDHGNYTNNSPFRTNLNTVLSSLSTNVNDTGFYAAAAGQNQNRVSALALCRGEVQLQICRGCIQNVTADLLNSCPNQMQAYIWYDFCMVRYSNESILGTLTTYPGYWLSNVNNVTSPDQFRADLRTLLDQLRGRAADGGPLMKVAAGNTTGPDFQTIFALVQCTPDLSPMDCTRCLIGAGNEIPACCGGRIGGRILRPSCSLRFESEPFFNETRLLELTTPEPASPAPPSPTTPSVPASPPPVIASLILAGIIGIVLRKKMKQRPKTNMQSIPHSEVVDEISTVESLQYDFSKIRAATDDFSNINKLGQGGFGAVYKGKLSNGQEIAVKRLSRGSGQGDLEFKNEVLFLSRLQHRNLVRLLGFSLGVEKLLVYEFVQNASLDQFIFDSTRKSYLDWERRYKIIGGIARGLLYLHEDSRLRIIHRDLKASNVLLDGDMIPKIADFGMARLFDTDETQGNTSRIVGTYGYMAPEYAMHGQFSVKSEVFSFGVLVLEIVSGQKNNSFRNGEHIEDLISCAWRNWREGSVANIIDPSIRAVSGVPRDLLRCIHIGLLCVQENASDRPTMASVVLMLNSFSLTLPVPSEPAFCVPSGYDSDHALLQESSSREIESSKSAKSAKSVRSIQNDVSVSDLYPR